MVRIALFLVLFASVTLAQMHRRWENPALLGIVSAEVDGKVMIAYVLPDSPAARAKLQPGDVLVSIHGEAIKRAMDVDRALQRVEPGTVVEVKLKRKRKKVSVRAEVMARGEYRGDLLKRHSRGETGFSAPPWYAYAWANLGKKEKPPTRESTQGKVVVFHTFQSW